MGYHRLLTHRAFETPRFFRYFLATIGTMAWQGGPIYWVGTHRMHHSESDQLGDPHSPHHGFGWGHILWCFVNDPFGRDARDAAKDLQKDRGMVWIDKFFYVPQIVLGVILYFAGGWSWVVWGIAVRTVVSYHSTWFVNSPSPILGYRNFDTKEESRNNWWVALISWGEGWHNNHHAFQRSASFGLRWFEFDITYVTIKALSYIGLTRNIYVPEVQFGSRGAGG
jgi:stearoyl-CoA desaturase (delta-9 desaturase)